MPSILGLVAATLMISPSGALSPGPLSTSAVILGAEGRGAREGAVMSLGHMAFELPYVYLLTRSAGLISSSMRAREIMTAASAAFIVFFAYLALRDAFRGAKPGGGGRTPLYGSFATGLMLTGLNPFFLAWWPSVAMPIIEEAAALGVLGFAVMYASHVWYDVAWLSLLSYAGRRGGEAVGGRAYSLMLVLFAAMLLLFGADMVLRVFRGVSLLPF